MKQVASELSIPKSSVQRALEGASVNTYYRQLISQCVIDLKRGEKAYCFTLDQLNDIKRLYPDLQAKPNGVGYTLTPL